MPQAIPHATTKRLLSQPLSGALLAMAAMLSSCTSVTWPDPAVVKKVVHVAWMNHDFSREIDTAVTCQDIGILVTTQGYAPGDDIQVTVGSTDDEGQAQKVKLHGTVDADGKARVHWPAMGCLDDVATPLLIHDTAPPHDVAPGLPLTAPALPSP